MQQSTNRLARTDVLALICRSGDGAAVRPIGWLRSYNLAREKMYFPR